MAQKRKFAFQISSYRSVLLGECLVLALAPFVMLFAFPDFSNRLDASGEPGLGKVLAKVGLGGSNAGPESGPQQAHSTNIDARVLLKKANGNAWLQADYSLALERNHVIPTSPEGLGDVVFTEGTNFTVKPDSHIVVQQNSLNEAKQTQVAVQVNTGAADLATSSISPGSKSQVSVACATASIASDTSAQVMNDPRHDEHEILAKKGSVVADRGGESVKLADDEKVSVTEESKEKAKSKEIGPPVLINPAKLQPAVLGVKEKTTMFSWSEVPRVRGDHVRVSKTAFLNPSSMVFDKNVTATRVLVPVAEGAYDWEVQSIGENGKESAENEKPARLMAARPLTTPSSPWRYPISSSMAIALRLAAARSLGPRSSSTTASRRSLREDGPFVTLLTLCPRGRT